MYRVLVVDDEEPVLDGYAFMLQQSGGDFTLAGKARSGFEAIRAIHELKPDVVFMDINIPEIDGIQAIAEVHSQFPSTVFILSTAYERFDLAQKAIPLGVFSYLVKPVSKKTFLATLDSVRDALRKRTPELNREEAAAAERRFLTETIWSELSEEDWLRCKERFSLHSDKGIVFLFDFSEDPLKWARRIAEGLSFRHRCLFSHRGNRAIFLVPEDADREELTESLVGIVGKEIPEGAVQGWAVGSVHRGPELYLSCEDALGKLRARERNADARHRERLRIGQIRRKIGILEAREIRGLFDSFWKDAFSLYSFPVAQARMVSFFSLLLDDYVACGGSDGEFPFDPAEEIMALRDLPEWEAWGTRAIGKLHRLFEALRSRRFPVPLVKAMGYVGEHFADRLQLSSAAEAAQVSAAYLSRLFSEHLNTTFIDYLTELRIRRAERLIAETRMSMKEIAFTVGYQDPNYFGKIFRKETGLSPTAFAAEHRSGGAAESGEEGL